MFDKKRIFISSVQKELELERAAVASLITTDPFLLQHCTPLLFEKEPPASRPARQPYLDALRDCAIYLLIIANEYGRPDGDLSATHHEYRLAQKLKLPTIVFLKGAKDETRSAEVRVLIEETKRDGYTYKRFHDREDLRPEVLRVLAQTLKKEFGITATAAELSEGEHLLDAASVFEQTVLADVGAQALDSDRLLSFTGLVAPQDTPPVEVKRWQILQTRGLAVYDSYRGVFKLTAAAFLLFGRRPADRFPQCEILVDAYDETRISGRPKGQLTINASLPSALEQALAFIDQHTFHPRRVVGLNNLRLDEYPAAALREALVNAVAHRNYEDISRKVFVRVFSDRIEISSPGYPPRPLTLAKLRKGGYRPCSRNPLIAQTLAILGVMEQRGSGFARMHDAMLDHGLDAPRFEQQDGFFVVTLPGPAGDHDRLKTPAHAGGAVTPAIEAQLNERQKRIVSLLIAGERLTSRRCEQEFGVTRDTASRDFALLVKLGLAKKTGRGRSIGYEQKSTL